MSDYSKSVRRQKILIALLTIGVIIVGTFVLWDLIISKYFPTVGSLIDKLTGWL